MYSQYGICAITVSLRVRLIPVSTHWNRMTLQTGTIRCIQKSVPVTAVIPWTGRMITMEAVKVIAAQDEQA